MKRKPIGSVVMAVLAGLALFANVAADVFAPVYTIPFRPYMGNGFIPGQVQLTMHSRETMKGTVIRGILFIGSDGRKMVTWKGHLAGELVIADKNDPTFPQWVAETRKHWEDGGFFPLSTVDMLTPNEVVDIPPEIPVVPRSDRQGEQTVIMCVITAVSIGHERREQLNAVIVNLRYPYGREQIYMPGGAVSVASRLIAMGHRVRVFDLNLDGTNDCENPVFRQALFDADLVGISLVGPPHVPQAIEVIRGIHGVQKVRHILYGYVAQIIIGGQAIEALSGEQFDTLFAAGDVRRITSDCDLVDIIGCGVSEMVDPFEVPFSLAWSCAMGEERVAEYLRHEMPLVVSQGCKYSCKFCAARKGMREQFRNIDVFENDLRYLCAIARRKGIEQLSFYATSLDFFQNPMIVRKYLEVLARVQSEEGVNIHVRCLSCVASFLKASEEISGFEQLLHGAGVWCVAVGVDGTSAEVWRAQRKHHNNMSDVWKFVELCRRTGIKGEALMVMGFPEDNFKTSLINIISALRFRLSGIVSRPYCAKLLVPGNDNWNDPRFSGTVGMIVENPELFYNLDFAAFGSKLTHPRRLHRWISNLTYAIVCAIGWSTSPLMPQGGGSRLARFINRHMPPDR